MTFKWFLKYLNQLDIDTRLVELKILISTKKRVSPNQSEYLYSVVQFRAHDSYSVIKKKKIELMSSTGSEHT